MLNDKLHSICTSYQTHLPQPQDIYLLSLSFQSTIRSKFSQRHLDMVPDNLITFRVLGKEEIRLQI